MADRNSCRKHKAQSAMEYLMTYGWAILVLSVVLAVLYSMGVLNPNTYSTQECAISSGFNCLSYTMTSSGVLHINLQQSTPDPITVTALACTQSANSGNFLAANQYLPIGSNATFVVQCYSSTGGFASAVGGTFGGTIAVNYTDQLTNLPGTAVGKLVVKVSSI